MDNFAFLSLKLLAFPDLFPNKVCNISRLICLNFSEKYFHFFIWNQSLLFPCYFCSYFIVGNHLKETIFKCCNYLVLVGSRTFKNIQGTLSRERCTNASTNLCMHLKYILGALISCTLKISIADLFIYPQQCSKTNCSENWK